MTKRATRRAKSITKSSQNTSRNYIIGGMIFLGLIGLGALLYLSLREPPPIRGVVTHPRPSRGHDNALEIPFGELPPVGGPHNDVWQNCGIYTEPILPKHAVHSMEHGTVWITYQPQLAEGEVVELQNRVRGITYILLSPFPEQRSPIVMTAWGLQLELDSVDDRRIGEFIERYRLGPQTPERGATCENGIGEPNG